MGKNKKLTGAALIVMSSIIVSRITGFVREMLVPNLIGVNEEGDAYTVAFKITGLMYDMLVGGAVSAALIPVLSGYIARDDEETGWKVVGTFINTVIVAMVAVCFLGIIFAPQVVSLIGAGFETDAQKQLTVDLIRILFPSVAFLMMAGLCNGVLNSYNRFCGSGIRTVSLQYWKRSEHNCIQRQQMGSQRRCFWSNAKLAGLFFVPAVLCR